MTTEQTLHTAALGAFLGAFLGLGGLLILAGLLAAAYTATIRAITTHQNRRTRHTQPDPDPADAIDAAINVALAGACCDTWYSSLGLHHDHTCPHHHRSTP